MIQHLHLDGAEKRLAGGGERSGPDEDSRIAAGFQMPPFQLQDEVLVVPLRTQGPGRHPITMQHPFLHGPGFRGAVHVDPAGQILAIEQGGESLLLRQEGRGEGEQEKEAANHVLPLRGIPVRFIRQSQPSGPAASTQEAANFLGSARGMVIVLRLH